jgi:S-DNA-T family DNA segregation ATPase FtsK/SpoIIIE
VQLHVYDFKGGQDWMPFEAVAHRFGVGDDREVMEGFVTDLRDLAVEMSRRYKVLRSLPSDVCPESKVTRELANKKSLGLHPIVLSVDECQRGFEHDEHGKEIEALTTDLVKRGPAVGIILVLATQKPDKDSLPSGIRDNIGARFGMRVMSWQVSDMVLGSGMSKAGFNAASLTRADKGIGYLVGASEDIEAQLARTYLIDSAAVTRVVQRARAAREAAGTLTGHAAGETVDSGPDYSILDDIRGVTGANEPKLWSETVLTRLVELRPDVYTGWKPAQLASALKPYGIGTTQVWAQAEDGSGGANKRGIVRDDIIAAITVRDRKKGIEAD